MPYIERIERDELDVVISKVAHAIFGRAVGDMGRLNYSITKLILAAVDVRKLSYDTIALVTGVLDNVKTEFYTRVAKPYEEFKRGENGDIDEIYDVLRRAKIY